jgi:hypothetical protein
VNGIESPNFRDAFTATGREPNAAAIAAESRLSSKAGAQRYSVARPYKLPESRSPVIRWIAEADDT